MKFAKKGNGLTKNVFLAQCLRGLTGEREREDPERELSDGERRPLFFFLEASFLPRGDSGLGERRPFPPFLLESGFRPCSDDDEPDELDDR